MSGRNSSSSSNSWTTYRRNNFESAFQHAEQQLNARGAAGDRAVTYTSARVDSKQIAIEREAYDAVTDAEWIKQSPAKRFRTGVRLVCFVFFPVEETDRAIQHDPSKPKSERAREVEEARRRPIQRAASAINRLRNNAYGHVELLFPSTQVTFTADVLKRRVYSRYHRSYRRTHTIRCLVVSPRTCDAMMEICRRMVFVDYGTSVYMANNFWSWTSWMSMFGACCVSSSPSEFSDELDEGAEGSDEIIMDNMSQSGTRSPSTSVAAWAKQMIEAQIDTRPLETDPNMIPVQFVDGGVQETPKFHTTREMERDSDEYMIRGNLLTEDEERRLGVVANKFHNMTCSQMCASLLYVLGVLSTVDYAARASPDDVFTMVERVGNEYNRNLTESANRRMKQHNPDAKPSVLELRWSITHRKKAFLM